MNITKQVIDKIDEVLSRGLCVGVGTQGGQVCVEAAICEALGEPHGDNPSCVEESVRAFKIRLNDSRRWISPESRAKGMRSLAIAQLGSKGVVDGREFSTRIANKTIRRLLPTLARDLYPNDVKIQAAALVCESEGTRASAISLYAEFRVKAAAAAAAADYAGDAGDAAAAAVYAAYADAAYAAAAAADAAAADTAYAYAYAEKYLLLAADLALETLEELGSPGCDWL
jgi:hypothetical protein